MAKVQANLPQTAVQWIARWKTRPLAILADTRARLNALHESTPDPSPADLSKIVQSDPFLVFLLLKAVNNRQRSNFSSEVIGIENALKLIGVERFQQQFGHLPLVEERLRPGSVEYALLLQQILIASQSAELARDWAVARLDMKPEEVYVAALLHNQAWCQLALHEPQLIGSWLPWYASPLQDDPELQSKLLGVSLADLQLALLQAESLPASLSEMMSAATDVNPRALTVQLAASFVRNSVAGWQHPLLPQHINTIAELTRKEADVIWNRTEKSVIDFARRWKHALVPASATWLPMTAGSWVAPLKQEAQAVQQPVTADANQATSTVVDFAARVKTLKSLLGNAGNFNQTMSLIIRELNQGLGLNRVVFALLSGDQQSVKARYVIGVDAADPLARFEFGLQAPSLLSKLMAKTASIWVNPANSAQYRRHLPPDWNSCVGDAEFYLMSLFVADKPIGLIMADSAGLRPLDEAGYNGFKQICLLTAQSLGQLAGKTTADTTPS